MSRSGYSDDYDGEGNVVLWRGAVSSAIKGRRGQAFLIELAAALDAMDVKELIEGELINDAGECCTIGAVCKARGLDVSKIDPEDPKAVGVSFAMAAEIAYMNEEWDWTNEDPAQRWTRMRKWVASKILTGQ